jgi:hypothetical protein
LREVSMQRGYVQVTRREERRPSRRGILLGLLPLTLLAAALVAAPAQADPTEANGCRVQLTAEEGASGPQAAELTWSCVNFDVQKILLASDSAVGEDDAAGKEFLAGPFDTEGGGLCTPADSPGTTATCRYLEGSEAGVIPISALDVCGSTDNEPLVLDVTLEELITLDGENAEPPDVKVQCTTTPPTTTPPTTTTPTGTTPPPASGTPGGTAGDTGGGGAGGVRGAEDSGQVPVGGVQSGAGGTAPADDAGAGLLAAVVGLMLAATLGLGIARVRSVRG